MVLVQFIFVQMSKAFLTENPYFMVEKRSRVDIEIHAVLRRTVLMKKCLYLNNSTENFRHFL
jgi:hypothetical protein